MLIKEMLTYYREEKGWTISDLARNSGLGTSHICQLENGRRIPTEPTLNALINALGIERRQIEIDNLIGINLLRIRNQSRMTQRDVELFSGLSKGHLSKLERGHRKHPDIATLRKVMSVYNLPLSELTLIPDELKEKVIPRELLLTV